jgi:hypothetical protein
MKGMLMALSMVMVLGLMMDMVAGQAASTTTLPPPPQ